MPRDRSKPWIDVLVQGDKAIVRKTTFKDNGNVAAKYGLTVIGEWVQVREGESYPDECILPVTFYDKEENA